MSALRIMIFILAVCICFFTVFGERIHYVSPELASYDSQITIRNTFGTGKPQTTDSPGLIGEVNNPIALTWDLNEQFIYTSDKNGGGLIRKLIAVDPKLISPDRFGKKFNTTASQVFMAVSTAFAGTNMNLVYSMILSPNGKLMYITSELNHNIRSVQTANEFDVGVDSQFNIAGSPSLTTGNCNAVSSQTTNTCLGTGTAAFDGIGSYTRFNTLYGIALQYSGIGTNAVDKTLFVTDGLNNKVRRIALDPTTGLGIVTTYDSNVETHTSNGRMISGGICIDSTQSKLFVSIIGAIIVYSPIDFTSPTLASTPGATKNYFVGYSDSTGGRSTNVNVRGYVDGNGFNSIPGKGPRFQSITFITRDDRDNLYVSDGNPSSITSATATTYESLRRVSKDGNVTTLVGKTGCRHSQNVYNTGSKLYWCVWTKYLMSENANKMLDGRLLPGYEAQVNFPQGLAVTRAGDNIFVADRLNNLIRQVGCAGGYNMSYGVCIQPTSGPTEYPTTSSTSSTAVPTSSTAVPTSSTVVPTSSTAVPTSSTAVPTSSTAVPTSSTAVPTSSTAVPTSSTVIPTSSTVIPTSSTVIPTSSTVIPTTSTVIPTTSTVIPTSSTAVPTSSAIIPTSSTAVPTSVHVIKL